jgi:tRNA U34 5-methylaminomethyl-2-thiouridine-forming methyltransferase MnmC
LKRNIIKTSDGSTTIHLPEWDECYHSKHGAIQEAYHVFIKNGLDLMQTQSINILEIGFGTGLNALITLIESEKKGLKINYNAVEAYPISFDEVSAMNYTSQLSNENLESVFKDMHESNWNEKQTINPQFSLIKRKQFFQDINDVDQYNLIYFDAFGYRVQPELWSIEIFSKMYLSLKENGVLVTYAARGVIKRAMEEAGFTVKKVPGPPGKREMMIAFK